MPYPINTSWDIFFERNIQILCPSEKYKDDF